MGETDKQEVRRLRESEEKYRKMIERAGDAILAIDTETARILEANPRAEAMTGYSARELVGMHLTDLHPPEEAEAVETLFGAVNKTGSGFSNSMCFLTKSGKQVAVDISASVITFGDKKIIQRICRDVTRRRRLEKQIAAQRDYYEFILDMLPVGLGVKKDVNRAPSIEFENRRLKEMFPTENEESDPRSWYDLPAGDLPRKTIIDDTGVYAEERTYPDGKVYQFTLNYYRNRENSWSELQLVQDVTRRRELEDQLQLAMEDLEQKVQERTLELRQKQAQLVQAEKMASLGNLVAGIAHEINTPLGALKSNHDLLVRSLARIRALLAKDLPEEAREHPGLVKLMTAIEDLNRVNQTAMHRIVTIVGSLRSFARLDAAEQDQVDIHGGLDSTLTLVHHEIKHRIRVHKDYGKLPLVYCYPNQLNQVFMNVLVNSSQAIEGDGDIHIKTSHTGDKVVVEIRDNGRGIPKENLERIFDPGFTTKGAGVGTGLGLSIVYQIIEDHHGQISVESNVGEGTTVRIVLPVA
ncbi:MAG: ATP-binding protein [Candidatus Krumholzibacteriia bacterium]